MRMVKFIRELVIDEVPLMGSHEVRYYSSSIEKNVAQVGGGDDFLGVVDVHEHIVPVHSLFKSYYVDNGEGMKRPEEKKTDELYIAFSDEVREYIDLPFTAMKEQIDLLDGLYSQYMREAQGLRVQCNELRKIVDDACNAGFFKRLKYLFTGDLV